MDENKTPIAQLQILPQAHLHAAVRWEAPVEDPSPDVTVGRRGRIKTYDVPTILEVFSHIPTMICNYDGDHRNIQHIPTYSNYFFWIHQNTMAFDRYPMYMETQQSHQHGEPPPASKPPLFRSWPWPGKRDTTVVAGFLLWMSF